MCVKRQIKSLRLTKSPFMIASVAGLLSLIASFFWVLSGVLVHYGIDIVLIVHFGLLITIPGIMALIIVSMVKYMKNGYMRKECTHEALQNMNERVK